MTSHDALSIAEITSFLQAETPTQLLQQSASWSGTAIVLLNQQAGYFKVPKLGFHLVEMCTRGKAKVMNNFDGLSGSEHSEYRPNALFYVPPNRPIEAEIYNGSMEVTHLYIEDRVFQDVARATYAGNPRSLDLYGFNGRYDPRMAAVIRSVQTEMQIGASSSAMMIDTAIQQLAILLMRQSHDARSRAKTQRITTLSPQDFTRALDMIETHLDQNIGLNAVASELDISVYNFCRSFKATAGVAPHQYLLERRISAVQGKLSNTTDTLADIAYATGFSSQAHMTTAFKRITGTTPGQYRKDLN